MKKSSVMSFLTAIVFAVGMLSSCKSIETAPDNGTTSGTVTSASLSEIVTSATIQNGNFGGIPFDDHAVTAASAAPIPQMRDTESSGTEETIDSGEYETEDTTTTATTAVTTTSASTTTTSAATTTAASTTTSATAKTTTATTTTAATTTTTAASSMTTSATTTTAATSATTTTTTTTTTAATEPSPVSGGSYTRNSYAALNHSYVKAVWISYIELGALYGKDEAGFRSGFAAMLDNCVSLGINTVYVHVRAFGDAYYYSDTFPFTKRISGTIGKRSAYDPLDIMIEEAHSRKISFHAWINPLRLGSTADLSATPTSYLVGKWYAGSERGKYVVNVGGTWFLNPSYPEVRKLIGDNVREIVSNYNVDGIHIDDYYYPTTDTSFDSAAFSASGNVNLSTFRVNNVNAMVKEMYTAAHECGSAVFGASPQGNNYNNLYVLYADTKAWCAGGYIDYFTPQIYYGFENGGVPFKSNVDEWSEIVKGTRTKLYAGLAVYKAGNEDKWAGTGKHEWENTVTMLKRQTEYANEKGLNGIALYSYNYIFTAGYNTSAMTKEIANLKPLLLG